MSIVDDHLHRQREKINAANRNRLTNYDFSVISSNCTGSFILHDLKLQFRSPFVNLFMLPNDFVRYLEGMEYYNMCKLRFLHNCEYSYPVAMLGDLTVHFLHYKDEEEAGDKWRKRLGRLNVNNLFIMMVERDGCTYSLLERFDCLPYKNKVVFTHKKYPEFESSFYIKGFEKRGEIGDLYRYKDKFTGKKYYDDFDYITWFNQGNK